MSRDFPATSGNYLSIGDVTAIDITGTALTIVAWIRPDAVASDAFVVAKRNNAGSAIQYQLSVGSNHVKARVGSGGASDLVEGATTITTGAWHHIAVVKNGTGAGALKAYLDGSEDGSATSNVSIADSAQALVFGRVSDTNAFLYDGLACEIAIWNVSLSGGEIAALAKGSSPRLIRPQNLAGYWPLYGTGSPEQDYSSRANPATINGTVDSARHAPVMPFALPTTRYEIAASLPAAPAPPYPIQKAIQAFTLAQKQQLSRGFGFPISTPPAQGIFGAQAFTLPLNLLSTRFYPPRVLATPVILPVQGPYYAKAFTPPLIFLGPRFHLPGTDLPFEFAIDPSGTRNKWLVTLADTNTKWLASSSGKYRITVL